MGMVEIENGIGTSLIIAPNCECFHSWPKNVQPNIFTGQEFSKSDLKIKKLQQNAFQTNIFSVTVIYIMSSKSN